jgi:hypothetical protein
VKISRWVKTSSSKLSSQTCENAQEKKAICAFGTKWVIDLA